KGLAQLALRADPQHHLLVPSLLVDELGKVRIRFHSRDLPVRSSSSEKQVVTCSNWSATTYFPTSPATSAARRTARTASSALYPKNFQNGCANKWRSSTVRGPQGANRWWIKIRVAVGVGFTGSN